MENEVLVPPRQYNILEIIVTKGSVQIDELAKDLGLKPEDLMRDLVELESKQLIITTRVTHQYLVVSKTGSSYLEKGFPEELALTHIRDLIGRQVDEAVSEISKRSGLPVDEVKIGIQYLVRDRCISIRNGVIEGLHAENCRKILENALVLKKYLLDISQGLQIPKEMIPVLKKRRLVELKDRIVIIIRAQPSLITMWKKGLIKRKEVLTIVKPDLVPYLDRYIIKEFDLTIQPPSPILFKKHPFMEFIDELREIMISLGFEEVKGPHVEAELWNFDVLFQAQDHPAREIHDTFYLKTSLKASPPIDVLERAKLVHEKYWSYKWSPERAIRLVLRSQTTAVTARAIYQRGPGEYRVFTIDRNFRPENLDAKHSMEFYQLDGVIVGKDVSFKHLLYFFKELAAALGIKEVWFKPGYFPFTEPSVEGYIKHPKLGWIEVFPGGMFRPEVMEILGAEGYNAAAWGIGVDRLAMTVLGLDDIRLLFTRDLDALHEVKYTGLPFFKTKASGRDVKVLPAPL